MNNRNNYNSPIMSLYSFSDVHTMTLYVCSIDPRPPFRSALAVLTVIRYQHARIREASWPLQLAGCRPAADSPI